MDNDVKGGKVIKITEMGDKDFSDYDEDTIFVLDEPPLRNPNDKDPKENK